MYSFIKITSLLLVLGSITSIPKVFSDNRSGGQGKTNIYNLYCPDGNWKHTWKEKEGHFHSCEGGMPSGGENDAKTCNTECYQTNKNPYD